VVVTVLAIMVGLASVVLTSSGVAPETLLSRLPTFGAMTLGVAYALVILSLWYAPIVGWLMLVSVWARRMTFLWAVAPPFGLCLLEMLALRTVHVWNFLHGRLIGGFAAYTVGGLGKAPLHDLSQIDVTPFLTDPGFWGGLVFAAVAFEACVRLRRRREPI
jgi:ABC-2 type transport system permease protein